MKQLTKRTYAAGVLFATLVLVGVVIWHYPIKAAGDDQSPSPASIASVEAHALTPGPISTINKLKPRGTCSASTVSYHSDGLKEYAIALKPAIKPPKAGYPVVVFAHGYTNPRTYRTDNTQYASIVTWYCEHDYLVFKPDYRGHGQSEGQAVNGLYSPDDTYDVLNLVASLPNYPSANANRVALVGHSMGGGVVLRATVASHNLPIKAVVTMAGAVASLPDLTYHWTGHVPPDVVAVRHGVIHAEGPPNQNPSYWHDGSAINYVKNADAPIQINQGLADASVPVSFSNDLNNALTLAGKTHAYYTYPDTGHLFANKVEMGLFLNRSTAFMDTYVK